MRLRSWLARRVRRLHDRVVLAHSIRLVTWWRFGRRHRAPIAPLQLVTLDPRTVDRWVDMEIEQYRAIRYQFGVMDGPWDLDTKPLVEHFVYASLEARFIRGADWSDTPLYAIAQEGIQTGRARYHGCRTQADLERRLEQLDTLFERVRRDGYRSQAELMRLGTVAPNVSARRPVALDEVVVHVDRYGGFILVDGVHRFSVARLLDVPRIPALILLRHAHWQAQRDAIALADGGSRSPHDRHPDLVSIARR